VTNNDAHNREHFPFKTQNTLAT